MPVYYCKKPYYSTKCLLTLITPVQSDHNLLVLFGRQFGLIVTLVMRKFAVLQSFLCYLENYKNTNSNLFPVDDQEFKYSTLYIANSLYTCKCATPTFIQ